MGNDFKKKDLSLPEQKILEQLQESAGVVLNRIMDALDARSFVNDFFLLADRRECIPRFYLNEENTNLLRQGLTKYRDWLSVCDWWKFVQGMQKIGLTWAFIENQDIECVIKCLEENRYKFYQKDKLMKNLCSLKGQRSELFQSYYKRPEFFQSYKRLPVIHYPDILRDPAVHSVRVPADELFFSKPTHTVARGVPNRERPRTTRFTR